MINPFTHPRRYAAHVERKTAERGRAMSASLSAKQAAERLGMTTEAAEQLAAKYGYAYNEDGRTHDRKHANR
jgi:hypothetical protein